MFGLFKKSKMGALVLSNDTLVIDVRSREEYARGHFAGAHNFPVAALASRLEEVRALTSMNDNAEIVVYCASGGRSQRAKALLETQGFTRVIDAGTQAKLKKARDERQKT